MDLKILQLKEQKNLNKWVKIEKKQSKLRVYFINIGYYIFMCDILFLESNDLHLVCQLQSEKKDEAEAAVELFKSKVMFGGDLFESLSPFQQFLCSTCNYYEVRQPVYEASSKDV